MEIYKTVAETIKPMNKCICSASLNAAELLQIFMNISNIDLNISHDMC